MEEVSTNKSNIDELREEAIDLGIEFHERLGVVKLQKLIDDKLEAMAEASKAKKVAKVAKAKAPKIKITVEHREGDDSKIVDQFFRRQSMATGDSEQILIQWGEEVEVSLAMFEHIKSLGGYIKKFRMVDDIDNGGKKKEWYDKYQTRFIVSKV